MKFRPILAIGAMLLYPASAPAVAVPADQPAAAEPEISESVLPAWLPSAFGHLAYWGIALGGTALGTAAYLAIAARRAAGERRHEMGQDLIALLVDHQEALRDLYRSWARRYPADASSWTTLAAARERQARAVESLFVRALKGEGRLRREDFPAAGIRDSRARLAALLGGKQGGPASAEEALLVGYSLETGVIEGGFLGRFDASNKRFEAACFALAGETDSQRDLLRREWEKKTGKNFAALGTSVVYGGGAS
jgi:hypothetical protein